MGKVRTGVTMMFYRKTRVQMGKVRTGVTMVFYKETHLQMVNQRKYELNIEKLEASETILINLDLDVSFRVCSAGNNSYIRSWINVVDVNSDILLILSDLIMRELYQL
ncbi:hypothetical protein LOTGIDRAFT_156853 [Lottia gigantea]|uniref:Uncharacterized protein n=1 Tax=Lottia gigantea TaxID=225164 RepID=V4AYX3_LOTGI|nr:hypothetical protein LOTGIDRAFT_156853 [Lottia gigantea]ESP02898.1 hypothetical protein LOTGIDRAFT_156853 [Lottia gigantea]